MGTLAQWMAGRARFGDMPYNRVWTVVLALAVGLCGGGAPAQGQPAPFDIERVGPKVGEPVADFAGRDQQGRTQTLQSLMGREGLMLVFSRSADW